MSIDCWVGKLMHLIPPPPLNFVQGGHVCVSNVYVYFLIKWISKII